MGLPIAIHMHSNENPKCLLTVNILDTSIDANIIYCKHTVIFHKPAVALRFISWSILYQIQRNSLSNQLFVT